MLGVCVCSQGLWKLPELVQELWWLSLEILTLALLPSLSYWFLFMLMRISKA